MTYKMCDHSLLQHIDSPEDLRRLPAHRLNKLADELRCFLIQSVSCCGGHFAAGLGTVELSVALHYVFNTPDDKLIWDIGHQAYPHKILTGRRDKIGTIRKKGGLAPFLKPSESPYDTFGAGHSSTSISVATGAAMAARTLGKDQTTIAVIGDGGMTAGMAYEAMNHAGSQPDLNLLVILNDNKMSISPNVGALNNYLTRILTSNVYNRVRDAGGHLLDGHMPTLAKLASHMKRGLHDLVAPPGNFFEELGFDYYGPIDGHDMTTLISTLDGLKASKKPRILHVVTCKGNGYEHAEKDPVKYHGVATFDPSQGIMPNAGQTKPSYSTVFGNWLMDIAERDSRVVAITPAMSEGSGMTEFASRFPDQYVDVGIAEQHSVTLAAGMASQGLKPIVAIYSTFLQRAYDQVVHDVALPRLPVLFAIDRAGLAGPDGPTHAGSYDLTFMRALPGLVIMAPADENECRQMLYTGLQLDQPAAVRYPRGTGPGVAIEKNMQALPIGKGEWRRQGKQLAILAFGSMVSAAEAAAEALDTTLINMRFVKPIDQDIIDTVAASHSLIVTIEENVVAGGAGEAVHEYMSAAGWQTPIQHFGLPDRAIDHGSREEMLAAAKLDSKNLERRLKDCFDRHNDRQPRAASKRKLRTAASR